MRTLLPITLGLYLCVAAVPLMAQPGTVKRPLPPVPKKAPDPLKALENKKPTKAVQEAAAEISPAQLAVQAAAADEKTRHNAIDALGEIGAKAEPAVPALINALDHADAATRWRAARTLASLGPGASQSVGALTGKLTDKDHLVRAHAARALGLMQESGKSAVPALAKAVKDENGLVRLSALNSLLLLKADPSITRPLLVIALEDPDPRVVLPALHAISDSGPDVAVPILIRALKNEKSRYWASLGLTALGPLAKDAALPLSEALTDKRPEVRMRVALALAEIGPEAKPATAALLIAAKDPEISVKNASSFALGRIATKEAIPVLQEGVKSDDELLRLIAAWGLAQISPNDKAVVTQAVQIVAKSLESKNSGVRSAAIRALTELKAPPEITQPLMEKAIEDLDPQVVEFTMESLAAQGAKAVPRVSKALKSEKLRGYSVAILTRIGPDAAAAVPDLIEALSVDNLEFRRSVNLALAAIGPAAKGAVPALINELNDVKSVETVPSAAFALGKIGPDAAAAVPVLREKLASEDLRAKMASAWALRQLQPEDRPVKLLAVPLFIEALKSDSAMIRSEAAESLGEAGIAAPNVIEALKKATTDSDAEVRAEATEALKVLGAK
ncbi:MAG: HEAT repeat domain-containing protein [Planctomycetota bacterium]|nr:HEAT repeat domain-containing protein [Planctomycetota bacterium]